MAVQCPQCGATSTSTDFCDDCGAKLSVADTGSGAAALTPALPQAAPGQAGRAEWHPEVAVCPEAQGGCGAARQAVGPFCRLCGFNFKLLQPAVSDGRSASTAVAQAPHTMALPAQSGTPARVPSVVLKVVVSCDRQLYDALPEAERQDLAFPEQEPPVEFLVMGPEVRIGRASRRNTVQPQIAANTDPGVSRQHAVLLLQEDGTYALLDTNSAGGTLLNGQQVQGQLTPVHAGDVLVLGAWTRMEILAR